jgi:hypothetical protein
MATLRRVKGVEIEEGLQYRSSSIGFQSIALYAVPNLRRTALTVVLTLLTPTTAFAELAESHTGGRLKGTEQPVE